MASVVGVVGRLGLSRKNWNDMKLIRLIRARFDSLRADDTGASLVEYALLIALIALVAVVAMRFFGSELSTSYSDIADSFP